MRESQNGPFGTTDCYCVCVMSLETAPALAEPVPQAAEIAATGWIPIPDFLRTSAPKGLYGDMCATELLHCSISGSSYGTQTNFVNRLQDSARGSSCTRCFCRERCHGFAVEFSTVRTRPANWQGHTRIYVLYRADAQSVQVVAR